jgi:predicted metal-dependent hydrolase
VYTHRMIVNIEGVGEVVIERSSRARRLRISVSPGLVRVSFPRRVSYARAEEFAREQAHWIRANLERMERREKASMELMAGLPSFIDPAEAREKIAYRMKLLAMENGFTYSRLTLRNQKTRWGSCSADNCISLNIQLARLPERLMDYVILHELVHTRFKGHGDDFWAELDRYVGDARKLRRELKKYMLKQR